MIEEGPASITLSRPILSIFHHRAFLFLSFHDLPTNVPIELDQLAIDGVDCRLGGMLAPPRWGYRGLLLCKPRAPPWAEIEMPRWGGTSPLSLARMDFGLT